uniref:Uncharacterized protein n=1 Tax=Sphaeramia orbicularis TaxID=375764 RepID=A0A673B8V8_9TELE
LKSVLPPKTKTKRTNIQSTYKRSAVALCCFSIIPCDLMLHFCMFLLFNPYLYKDRDYIE